MGRLLSIQRKWDALAAPQLRAELERLRIALDAANQSAAYWMDVADGLHDDLLLAIEDNGGRMGLTKDGHVVPIHNQERDNL